MICMEGVNSTSTSTKYICSPSERKPVGVRGSPTDSSTSGASPTNDTSPIVTDSNWPTTLNPGSPSSRIVNDSGLKYLASSIRVLVPTTSRNVEISYS